MGKICLVILFVLIISLPTYAEDVRIKISFNNEVVIVRMFNSDISREFISKLPITLSFQDYVGTEKISYLPEKLKSQPSSLETGDFTYYAPWGNIAIFYKGNGGRDIIHLGKIEKGKDKLASQRGNFSAIIERIN